MNELDELKDKVFRLQEDIESVSSKIRYLEKKEKKKRPEPGDIVYGVNVHGNVEAFPFKECYGSPAFFIFFRTEKEAETWYKIKQRVYELIGDWEPDWGNKTYDKIYLYYQHSGERDKKVHFESARDCQDQGVTYMPEHAAITLLQEFTQEELKIWVQA